MVKKISYTNKAKDFIKKRDVISPELNSEITTGFIY